MENKSTNMMLMAVRRAKDEVKLAERVFANAARTIETVANYTTIDIYNMSKAVEITAKLKKATDELYASYETILRTLDLECRPLLDQGAQASAIKEVAEMMKYINEESSGLRSNITASLNGLPMGDIRTEHYMASIEARIIEKFWSQKYSIMPEAVEERKRRAALEGERRKRLAEQARREAAEEKKIKEANAAAKVHMDNCVKKYMGRVDDFQKALKESIERKRVGYQREIDDKVSELQAFVSEQEKRLAELGFFKMSEKKEAREEIKRLKARILKYQNPTIISSEIEAMEKKMDEAVEKYRSQVEDYLSRRFPDYSSDENNKQKSKNKLLFVENETVAKTPCPAIPEVRKVFK